MTKAAEKRPVGPLKNSRHERFAQELAKGKSQAEAYETAGYAASEPHASRLARNGKVEARRLELLGRAAAKVEITVADIAAQLDEDRRFARAQKQSAAAVSATMGKAKVLGLIVDRANVAVSGAIGITITSDDAAL